MMMRTSTRMGTGGDAEEEKPPAVWEAAGGSREERAVKPCRCFGCYLVAPNAPTILWVSPKPASNLPATVVGTLLVTPPTAPSSS